MTWAFSLTLSTSYLGIIVTHHVIPSDLFKSLLYVEHCPAALEMSINKTVEPLLLLSSPVTIAKQAINDNYNK